VKKVSNEPYKTAEKQQSFFMVIGALFGLLMVFVAGTNMQDKAWFEAVSNLMIATLFIGTVVIAIHGRNQELRNRLAANERDEQARLRQAEARDIASTINAKVDEALNAPSNLAAGKAAADQTPKDKLFGALDALFDTIVADAEQYEIDMKNLKNTVTEMGLLEDKPNHNDFPRIAERYAATYNRYVQFTSWPDGKFSTEFSDKPFDKVVVKGEADNTTDPAPAQTTTTTTKRKLSLKQQRKANEKKGHGPITDAELRAKKAAERKAKREAAKAETTTTTTTVVE